MCCEDHIYPVPEPWGVIVLICNIVFPGLGTEIQSYYAKDGCSCGTYMVGVAQSITSIFIVGWIWAIWHGLEVYKISGQQAMVPQQQVIIVQNGAPMNGQQVVYTEQQTPLVQETVVFVQP